MPELGWDPVPGLPYDGIGVGVNEGLITWIGVLEKLLLPHPGQILIVCMRAVPHLSQYFLSTRSPC